MSLGDISIHHWKSLHRKKRGVPPPLAFLPFPLVNFDPLFVPDDAQLSPARRATASFIAAPPWRLRAEDEGRLRRQAIAIEIIFFFFVDSLAPAARPSPIHELPRPSAGEQEK